MKFSTSIVATMALATTTLANTLTFTSFGLLGCSEQQLQRVMLSDTACQRISSGGFTAFTTTNIAADAGCNVVFSDSDSCATFDNVVTPNEQQCFAAVSGLVDNEIGQNSHAKLFCS